MNCEIVQFDKGARPIKNNLVAQHYTNHVFGDTTLATYGAQWRKWLTNSDNKVLLGLDSFQHQDYTHGTSQTFDQFVLRHCSSRTIAVFKGEFQYHACISKKVPFEYIESLDNIQPDHALIISLPFSDLGCVFPNFEVLLNKCTELQVPVCLDLAYWGIAKNIHLNLDQYPCIVEVASSLSKPFFTLENHRVGIRFSRNYLDDGISMINEVNMQNFFSMSLGVHYMKSFSCDWNWKYHSDRYKQICLDHALTETDTVIFGIGKSSTYQEFERGIPGNYRVCVSKLLTDI